MPGFRSLEEVMHPRPNLPNTEKKEEVKEEVNLFSDFFLHSIPPTPKRQWPMVYGFERGGFTRREGLLQKLWRKIYHEFLFKIGEMYWNG